MEKDIFNINKNQLSYGRGYVYSLQYHLVWCTKYSLQIKSIKRRDRPGMQKDAAGSGRRVSVSDPGNGSHAGSYPHACGLSAAVLYFRYDQDHERESCTSDVPFTSGAEKRTVGRTFVEPVLLCRYSQ